MTARTEAEIKHLLKRVADLGYPRIAASIEATWSDTVLDAYFSKLLMDERGNRAGFPEEVFSSISRLYVLHAAENGTFKESPWDSTNLR